MTIIIQKATIVNELIHQFIMQLQSLFRTSAGKDIVTF